MATYSSIGDYGTQIKRFAKELDTTERVKITLAMAKAGQKIAEREAKRDVGSDLKFSGWEPRLDTQIKQTKDGDHILMPTRYSAGPWTVVQRGRNQGGSTGFAGPGVNTRTGLTARTKSGAVRRARSRKAKRWNGYTRGKGTASRAVALMQRDAVKAAEAQYERVLDKYFDVT